MNEANTKAILRNCIVIPKRQLVGHTVYPALVEVGNIPRKPVGQAPRGGQWSRDEDQKMKRLAVIPSHVRVDCVQRGPVLICPVRAQPQRVTQAEPHSPVQPLPGREKLSKEVLMWQLRGVLHVVCTTCTTLPSHFQTSDVGRNNHEARGRACHSKNALFKFPGARDKLSNLWGKKKKPWMLFSFLFSSFLLSSF